MWKRKIVLDISSSKDNFTATLSANKIDFVMQSTLGWAADELKIDIYNLDPALTTKLFELEDKQFTLSAGYEDDGVEELMTGVIVNVWGRKVLPNHITTLWCVPLNAQQNNKKLEPLNIAESTVKSIIETLVSKAGYNAMDTKYIGFDEKNSRLSEVIRNYSTKGTFIEEIDLLGKQHNFRFNCASTFVKIISNTINNTVVDLMIKNGVDRHEILPYMIKGTPELTVAHTSLTVNLNANIRSGDVLDYSLMAEQLYSMQNLFGVSGENAILYRDSNAYNYIVRDKYQIQSITHTGSNFGNVWETSIVGTVFNEYVTVGSEEAQESAGVVGFTPSVASAHANADGSLTAYFPGNANDKIAGMIDRAKNVSITDAEREILFEVAGQNTAKYKALENVLRTENQGFGYLNNDAVSPAGAVGAFQFMPKTAANLGVKDRKNFRQSAIGAGKLYDEVANRYGGNMPSPETFYADYHGGSPVSAGVAKGDYSKVGPNTADYLAVTSALEGGE